MQKIGKFLLFIIIFIFIIFFSFQKIKFSIKPKAYTKIEESEVLSDNTEWKLTQFGSNEGGQMMSFTVEGDKTGLLIIDGGYNYVEEQHEFLIKKIKEHENIVDAWIITHFDADHAGEFIRIMNEENDIVVRKIYVPDTPLDLDLLKQNNALEHDLDIYNQYLNMDLPQKIKVHTNDKFEIIGLKMKILCSYEDWINEKTDNLLNNGSIVFKLIGKKESILFCADVQSSAISDYLIKNCKKDLKSEYIQVAHHGNNSLGEQFYKLVSPKIAFFCSPDWLMNNEKNIDWFTVEENKAILENIGTKCLWHNTSPNEVLIK